MQSRPAEKPDTTAVPRDTLAAPADTARAGATGTVAVPVDSLRAMPALAAQKGAPMRRTACSYAACAGAAWNILVLPELESWETRISKQILDTAVLHGIAVVDHNFESFNNCFAPHAGVSFTLPSGISIACDAEYISLSKEIAYTVTRTDSTGTVTRAAAESMRFRAIPVSLSLSLPVPETFFSISDFLPLTFGAGICGLAWVGLTAEGALQSEIRGSGYSIGYLFSLGTGKEVNPYVDYRALVRYESAQVKSFSGNAGTLPKSSLGEAGAGDFSLSAGMLQFVMRFDFHKPDPFKEREKERQKNADPQDRQPGL